MRNLKISLLALVFLHHSNLVYSQVSDLNFSGYTSYTRFKDELGSVISNKTLEGIQFILKHSSEEKTMLLSYTSPEHIIFFQLFHSVIQDNSVLTNVLIETVRMSGNNKKRKPASSFRNWLESKFNFNDNDVYKFIKTISGGKSKGINDIPPQLAEIIMLLDNRYKVFEQACSIGDSEPVKWFLDKGYPLKDVPLKSLEDSFRKGHINVVETLLKFNHLSARSTPLAVLKGQYFEKQTFLHAAAAAGFLDIITYLLSQGVDINAKDAFGRTPLYRAVEFNKVSAIKSLISAKADKNIEYGDSGDSILHVAALFKNVDSVKTLLEVGLPVNIVNKKGQTPLHTAAKAFSAEVVSFLKQSKADVNSKDISGDTPLHIASLAGNLESVQLLLKLGAKIDEPNYLGQVSLFKAVESGQIEIIKELVNKMPSIITATTAAGDSVMHLAADIGNVNVIKTLSSLGAVANKKNKKEQVPLYLAALKVNIKAASVLRDKTDLNAITSGKSMLHEAALDGNANAAKILIKSGINADIRGLWDNTPLHIAAGLGTADVVQVLLENKADPNAQNKNLMTPLHKAALGGHLSAVQLLINGQADPKKTDTSGKTALDLAKINKHANVVQYLSKIQVNIDNL